MPTLTTDGAKGGELPALKRDAVQDLRWGGGGLLWVGFGWGGAVWWGGMRWAGVGPSWAVLGRLRAVLSSQKPPKIDPRSTKHRC